MLASKKNMSPSSSRKTSYVDSEFHERLLRIMGHRSTVPSSNILLEVKNQEPILNTSLSTKQRTSGGDKKKTLLNALKKRLEGVKKKSEWMSYLESYGLIGQHPDDQWGPLLSPLLMGWRSLFQLRLACPLPKQSSKTKGIMMKNS